MRLAQPENAHADWLWARNKTWAELATFGSNTQLLAVLAEIERRLAGGKQPNESNYQRYSRQKGLRCLADACTRMPEGSRVQDLREQFSRIFSDPRHPGYRED